jgi:hypothetical protein
MAYYLIQAAYTPEAWAKMVKSPQDRKAAIAPMIEKLGGRLESFWMSFGDYDAHVILQAPDNVTAAAPAGRQPARKRRSITRDDGDEDGGDAEGGGRWVPAAGLSHPRGGGRCAAAAFSPIAARARVNPDQIRRRVHSLGFGR